MRNILYTLCVITGFSGSVWASDVTSSNLNNVSASTADVKAQAAPRRMSTEIGFEASSIGGGNSFVSAALLGDLQNSILIMGVRALMPVDFNEEQAYYRADLVGRWFFNRSEHKMYLEGQLSQHMSVLTNDETYTPSVGVAYGYLGKVAKVVHVGGAFGVDYLMTPENIDSRRLISKATLIANIEF